MSVPPGPPAPLLLRPLSAGAEGELPSGFGRRGLPAAAALSPAGSRQVPPHPDPTNGRAWAWSWPSDRPRGKGPQMRLRQQRLRDFPHVTQQWSWPGAGGHLQVNIHTAAKPGQECYISATESAQGKTRAWMQRGL